MNWRRVGGLVLMVAVVALTVREIPELIRYLKMESM
jgi:hypothetical protein